MNPRERVRERVNQLPDAVRDCERCNSSQSMQIRRSSLNEQFLADDIGLKCSRCYYYATHGVAFQRPGRFHEELDARGGRVLDFTRENQEPAKDRLRDLGYVAAAKEESQ